MTSRIVCRDSLSRVSVAVKLNPYEARTVRE